MLFRRRTDDNLRPTQSYSSWRLEPSERGSERCRVRFAGKSDHARDLKRVLSVGAVAERRALMKGFAEEITKQEPQVTIRYRVPMLRHETGEVLPRLLVEDHLQSVRARYKLRRARRRGPRAG